MVGTRRCGYLLKRIRERSDNIDRGPNAGISDEHIIDRMNDAIERLQSMISTRRADMFINSSLIDMVSHQEEYSLPTNMLTSGGINAVRIRYSSDDWNTLERLVSRERHYEFESEPYGYTRLGNTLRLIPAPDRARTNGLLVEYVKRLDRIGLRRGKINADGVTINFSVSTDEDEMEMHLEAIQDSDYICLVDRDGNILQRNVAIEDASLSGTDVTLTLASGYSITAAAGSYVICGKDTSSHQIELDRVVERYIISFTVSAIKNLDASNEVYTNTSEFQSMENEILEAYDRKDEDVLFVPELEDY